MNGWTHVGDDLVCALCGTIVVSVEDAAAAQPAESAGDEHSARNKLSQFLGVDHEAGAQWRRSSEDDVRFCKECIHFIKHPFQTHCGFWEKSVDPMGVCTHFERLPEEDAADASEKT